MRAGLFVLAIAACGPKVSTSPHAVDRDLDAPATTAAATAPPAEATDAPRAVAPPGKGLRTGTIARAHLVAVLDAGPATFLRQLEVAPRLSGDRFVGWQLVQLLDHAGPLHDVDLAPGDVLLAINGKPLSRPEQLQVVWDSLRTANEVTAQMWRGAQKLELRFAIEPAVAPIAR
jgi:S1-C subfamily serine protease